MWDCYCGEQLEAQYENTATETYTEVIQYFTPAPRVNQISLNNGIDISFGSDFNINEKNQLQNVEYEYDYEIVMNMGIPSKKKTKKKVKKPKSKQTGYIKLATGSLEVIETTPVKSGAYIGTTVGSPKTPITAQEMEVKYEYEYETVTDLGVPSKMKLKKIAKRLKSKQIGGIEKSSVPSEVTKGTLIKSEAYVGTTIGSPKAHITVNESKEPLTLGKQKKSVVKPQ
uniref:G5 domain-containing protein n=1 Tax=Romanomermis culicivorax TaxID=13658 RepID=A0A915IKH5_ROMCU